MPEPAIEQDLYSFKQLNTKLVLGQNCIDTWCKYIGKLYPNEPGAPADKITRGFHVPTQGTQPDQKKE
jgi:hypothetical protein